MNFSILVNNMKKGRATIYMREKTIAIIISAIIILLLSTTLIWMNYQFSYGDNQFVLSIENSIKYARENSWDLADIEASKVIKMWDKGNHIVAFKYSESDFTLLNIYLFSYDNAMKTRDLQEAEKEAISAIYLFNNMTSISPLP
jgi:hypothetical protein